MKTKQALNEIVQLGEPVEHRGVVIAPLFPRRQPRAQYVTLEDSLALGFRVRELDEAGVVPTLAVENPLDANVLLYDGEELVGAKQNRILNVTVLVPAESKTAIPVSCVEEGRWSRRSQFFAAAPHAAYPELRRRKAERLSAAPLEAGLAQGAVWDEVSAKSARLRVDSPTRAQADIFRSHEASLAELRRAFPPAPGQSGALFALGDRMCVDYVSGPDAFVQLYPKLLEGYLLDAIERLDGKPTGAETLEAFLREVESAPSSRAASVALGEDVRLRGKQVVGSGLELEGELVQLCAFSTEGAAAAEARILRPSRRAS